jgi:predicted transglutaminase-like cysteine proteinase
LRVTLNNVREGKQVGFVSIRATVRPLVAAGVRCCLGLGTVVLALTGMAAPAFAQENSSDQGEAITVVGHVPQRPTVPNVFGTIAVPFGTTPVSARWTRIMTASVNAPVLSRFTAAAQSYSAQQKASFVQAAINRAVRSRTGGGPCGTDDGYWAAATETLARGTGDCIDIAIAKVEALRQLGFASSDLYLVTGRVFTGRLEAGLLVRMGGQFWMLDAHSDQIVEAGHMTSFSPIVTYGVGMTWAHGVPVRSREIARAPAPVQTAAKSEGTRVYSGLDDNLKSSIRALSPSK